MGKANKTDVAVEFYGTIVLVRPLTKAAKAWVAEKVDPNAMWFGGAVAVEPRYVDPIVEGMTADGLAVR